MCLSGLYNSVENSSSVRRNTVGKNSSLKEGYHSDSRKIKGKYAENVNSEELLYVRRKKLC